jgi:hypothetical protein
VDCSIEYELPNAPKIPKNSQPILMIPLTYQKKLQQLRTSPCSGPSCRQCQEASRSKLPETAEPEQRKASKRSYAVAVGSAEALYKQSMQGKPLFWVSYTLCLSSSSF